MTSRGGFLIAVFGTASLVAVLAGCWTASQTGVPVSIWGRMVAAWAVGLVVAVVLARMARVGDRLAAVGAIGVTALVMLSFVDAGLEGVHRWIVIGPVRVNVAAMALPALIAMLAGRAWAAPVALAIMVLLMAQPDASQASGFAVAMAIFLLAGPRGRFAWLAIAVVAALAVISWLRPDPLASVPEVEGIVALAWGQHPALAILAVAALLLATMAPMIVDGAEQRDPAARAVAAYMLITAIMPAIGAFPVPLIGMSMSPIMGFWLGIGLLAQRRNPRRPPQ